MSPITKIASRRQLLQLAGMCAQNLPPDLPHDIVQEWIDEPVELRKFLEKLRIGTFDLTQVKTREIEVMIDPSRSTEQWFKARKCEFNHDDDIRPHTIEKFLTVKRDVTGPYKATVVAFNLGCDAGLKKVLRIRERLGLKPVGFEHEAALAEQHPKLIAELDIIVNPDVVIEWHMDNSGSSYHSYLQGHQNLGTPGDANFGWYGRTWFLGLKE